MMKRHLALLGLTLVVVAAVWFGVAAVASANGGPHGNYTPTTDACAGCHRAHTAQGPFLLKATSTYALCTSCHGAAGSGANTNVDDGKYLSTRDDTLANGNVGAANTPDNSDLLGGGFQTYKGITVTSSHDPTGATTAAWGFGVARGATGNLSTALDCASCHNPHGSTNYRIFNETIEGNAVSVAQVDEGAAKDYDTEQWGAGYNTLCAACHGAYHVTQAGAVSIDAASKIASQYGNATSTWAHRVGMSYVYGTNANPETVGFSGGGPVTYTLPLAQSGTVDEVVCTTCHIPHGTSAQMTGFAVGQSAAGDSALLRLDNRGVCEVCHQK